MANEDKPPVVDFAGHYYPSIPDELVAKHDDIERFDGTLSCRDLDSYLARYREAGVDEAVLSQPYFMGARGDRDLEAVAEANDALLDDLRTYDEFYGLASIPVAEGGELAADEFDRCLEAGFNGGALETSSDGVELIDDDLEPVFEVGDRTGAPILVHPNSSFHEDGTAAPSGREDHWLITSTLGTEFSIAESLIKVIHDGILDRYPNLNLVFHHNGGNIPSMLPRVEMWLNRTRRSGGEHLKPFDEFVRQVEQQVYIDTAGYYGDPGPFENTFELFPASQVLFGTDFPYETLRRQTFRKIITTVERLNPSVEAEGILGGTAIDLLVNC